jgi:hypothetical protein
MVWLITGLLLAVLGGLVVLTRWARRPPVTDDTLLADLLGPSGGQALPAPAGRDDTGPPLRRKPVEPTAGQEDVEPTAGQEDVEPTAGQEDVEPTAGQEDAERRLVPAGLPAGEGGWLENQIALIAAWSERMQEQIASWADDPDLADLKLDPAVAASLAAGGRRADDDPPEPPQAAPAPERCTATTARGGRCKFAARPGTATCTIHTKQAQP